MIRRKLKQIVIIAVYIFIFLGIVFFIFSILHSPSCKDGIENGKEEGIDCGGECPQKCEKIPRLKELKISPITIIPYQGKCDLVAEITNANQEYGFDGVEYVFSIYKDKNKIDQRSGKTYILPNEGIYLIETKIPCEEIPDKAELEIKGKEAKEFQEDGRPKLEVLNKSFHYSKMADTFFEVNFQVANRSGYDFYSLDMRAIVVDESGNFIAINKSNINSIKSGEIRDFRIFWPSEFKGSATEVIIEVSANTLNLGNVSR